MKYLIGFFVTTLFWSYVYACTTPLGVKSNCVVLYECEDLYNAYRKRPITNEVSSYLRQSQCGFEEQWPKVCCGPLPVRVNPNTVSSGRRPAYNGPADPVINEDSYPSERCGIDTNTNRIFGGNVTDIDEFPWMALLGYRTRSNTITYQCGGVLINRRVILTAAHCMIGAIERVVGYLQTARLGEYDINSDRDCVGRACADPVQEIPVQSSHPHSGYSDANRNRRDDIGLIRLARRVTLSFYVQPICLTDSSLRLQPPLDLMAAGWGKTENGTSSAIKLKVVLPLYDKNECTVKYRTQNADLIDKQICAGGVLNKDACRGDSGGPLMWRRPEAIWEVVGIISFGNDCGQEGWPGVYTSVASYLDWIQNTMRNFNV